MTSSGNIHLNKYIKYGLFLHLKSIDAYCRTTVNQHALPFYSLTVHPYVEARIHQQYMTDYVLGHPLFLL
jgi:hypothetical protein